MTPITNNFYIVCAELRNNIWCGISTSDVLRAIEQKKNLYVVDKYSNFINSTYSLFEIDRYAFINPIDSPQIYLQYQEEELLVLPKVFQLLLIKMHWNWINLGWDYFISDEFLKFLKLIQNTEIPDYVDRWNSFSADPYKLKGAIISEYSYPQAKFHSGYALGTFDKAPATLIAIEKALKDSKPFNWHLDKTLISSFSQIFLMNKEFVYGVFDEEFFKFTINMLNKLHLKAVLLLGEGLYQFEEMIDCGAILKEQHPLPILKQKQEYKTDVFKQFETITNVKF